jgi:hypothetical protein
MRFDGFFIKRENMEGIWVRQCVTDKPIRSGMERKGAYESRRAVNVGKNGELSGLPGQGGPPTNTDGTVRPGVIRRILVLDVSGKSA